MTRGRRQETAPCPGCHGDGCDIWGETCHICNGHGFVWVKQDECKVLLNDGKWHAAHRKDS